MLVRLYTKQMDAHIFKNIDELVREDRVHRRVYTDPAIFDLEMKRIFGSAWLYVGHQSQVPKVGDFVTCELAAQPVVMLRHHDGEIHVLFNRCAHRGARICEADDGNVKLLQCPYHGWTYDTAGRFLNSALHRDYAAAPERDTGRLDLRAVARVTSYRGFVFASLAATGPTLEESFGPMLSAIDNLVDRSPDGELELLPGVHRTSTAAIGRCRSRTCRMPRIRHSCMNHPMLPACSATRPTGMPGPKTSWWPTLLHRNSWTKVA